MQQFAASSCLSCAGSLSQAWVTASVGARFLWSRVWAADGLVGALPVSSTRNILERNHPGSSHPGESSSPRRGGQAAAEESQSESDQERAWGERWRGAVLTASSPAAGNSAPEEFLDLFFPHLVSVIRVEGPLSRTDFPSTSAIRVWTLAQCLTFCCGHQISSGLARVSGIHISSLY